MSEESNIIVDPNYISPEQLELHQKKWRDEQVPNPVEGTSFQEKKVALENEYGLPVCIFETDDQLTLLGMLPEECYASARKKFTRDETYGGEVIVFSEENPERVFLLDLSFEEFGVLTPVDDED